MTWYSFTFMASQENPTQTYRNPVYLRYAALRDAFSHLPSLGLLPLGTEVDPSGMSTILD